VLETIARLNACLPTASGVQAISANLINLCSTFEGAQSVLDLQLKAAICYLNSIATGTVLTQTIPVDGIDYTMLVGPGCQADLYVYSAFAKSWDFPNLVTTDGSLVFATLPAHDTPNFNPDGNMSFLQTINLPLYTNCGGDFYATGLPLLRSLQAPLLTEILGLLNFQNNLLPNTTSGLLTDVNFDSLQHLVGDFICAGNPSLVDLAFPALTHFEGFHWSCIGCALSEASINSILVTLANLSPPYQPTGFIDLELGTNAAPTGAGLAAKSALQGTGVTVNTN
jgi:hypothetical protein